MWDWVNRGMRRERMTNTLHRRGSLEEMERDYVVKTFGSGGDIENAAAKREAFKEIALKYNPISPRDDVHEFVFDNTDSVKEILSELKGADLGLSVTVSGLVNRVVQCCQEAGIGLHTVEHSLGIMGRLDRLPSDNVLDISSLCGHGMISNNIIHKVIDLVKRRRISPKEGAAYLSKPCTCGSFNAQRAEEILERMRILG